MKREPHHVLQDLLPVEMQAALEGLVLPPPRLGSGHLAGSHASTRRGQATSFHSHQPYVPGDDIRKIDWRVFARTDRYHIKHYDDEVQCHYLCALDASASMGFSGQERTSKFERAKQLSCALTWLGLQAKDGVGLYTFGAHQPMLYRPRSSKGQLLELANHLHGLEATGQTSIGAALLELWPRLARGTTVFVMTDLIEQDEQLWQSIGQGKQRKHSICVIQLLTREELQFDYMDPSLFVDVESGQRLFVYPQLLRNYYVRHVAAIQQAHLRSAHTFGIHYFTYFVEQSPAQFLRAMLTTMQHKPN